MNHLNLVQRYYLSKISMSYGIYRGQPHILEHLLSHDGCTQKELATAMHVSTASVAVSLKRMEKNGLIQRKTDQEDLRCNRIYITARGKSIQQKVFTAFTKLDQQMLSGFSAEEFAQLQSYLVRMTENLTTDDVAPEDMLRFIKVGIESEVQDCD